MAGEARGDGDAQAEREHTAQAREWESRAAAGGHWEGAEGEQA